MKIYALSNSIEFAKLLIEKLNNTDEHFELLKVNKQKFADGEINVTFNESIRGQSLVIVAQIQMPYENLFELLLTLDAARRCAAKEIVLVIPYLPHSRQERRDEKRSPITSRLVADLLQNAGADRIISMDLHTSAIEGNYSIPFDKLYPFELYVQKIKEMKIENLCLVSPDFGFMKKMEKYQNALQCDMAVINKTRLHANQIDKMELIGNVEGKNVIIIDDIVDTATTLVKGAHLVLDKGALSVTVFTTHGVLSYVDEINNAMMRLSSSKIKHTYISNTINHGHMIRYDEEVGTFSDNETRHDKITMIDVTDIFAAAISKIGNE